MVGTNSTEVNHFLVYEYDERDSFTTNIIGVYASFEKAYTKIVPNLNPWRETVFFIEEWQDDKVLNTHRY